MAEEQNPQNPQPPQQPNQPTPPAENQTPSQPTPPAQPTEQSPQQPATPPVAPVPQTNPVPPAQPSEPATPVDPAPATPETPMSTQQPAQENQTPPAPATIPSAPNLTPPPPPPEFSKPGLKPPVKKVKKAPNTRKMIVSCLSAAGCGFIFFVVLVLFAINQLAPDNPISQALGIDQNTFVNMLIILVNLVFGITAFSAFIAAIVGIFKAGNARKDDKQTKQKGFLVAIVSFVLFIFILFIWFGVYSFLNSKRSQITDSPVKIGINTVPENTIGLTAPVTIEFDTSRVPFDTRRHQLLSVNWDFGDGSTGTGEKISHEYETKGDDGRFTVTLRVQKRDIRTGEETTDTYQHEIFIDNEKIKADIQASITEGEAPLEVEFDGSDSKDPDGRIISWEWDLDGDGQYDKEGEKVSYTYEKVGEFKVKLRVVDNSNEAATTEQTITVGTPNVPVAVIDTNAEDDNFKVGQAYTFKGDKSTSPAGKIIEYNWDFGDGTPAAKTRTASHSYKEPGTYVVTLSVADEDGEKAESTKEITVKAEATKPTAAITTVPALDSSNNSLEGKVPFEVSFSGSKSTDSDDNIVDYEWDLDGDGKTDEVGENIKYTYTKVGNFSVTLTVTDADGNTASSTATVVTKQQDIQARVTATPIQGTIPLTVEFDASGSTYPGGKISSYEWDFGDGSQKRIDAANVTYKYTKIGTFTANVTAIGDDNKRATTEISINVRPVSLTACFSPTRTEGNAPLTVIFDPRCSTGTIAKYNWNFGDGETTQKRKPTHTFTRPGSYKVVLEVADNQNVINTYEQNILVTGELTE